MRYSVLIPHFRTLKMTAYTVSQFIKYKGKHQVDIIVIDNSYPDDSIRGLDPFKDEITIISNTNTTQISSHGVAFDIALPHVKTDWFITAESDSFPTQENWLDYYENLINQGHFWGGSLLKLSGGEFIHPTGAFYHKHLWEEAKKYVDGIEYNYFPNMSVKNAFESHLMVHNRAMERILEEPGEYMDLAKDYIGKTKEQILEKLEYYKPIGTSVFHNGMGNNPESIKAFQQRNIISEPPNIILDNKRPLIERVGYEPGQFFCYWLLAMKKKCAVIPTEIKWVKNRAQQQQEYTLMEHGFKHLWSVSAYFGSTNPDIQDIVKFKTKAVDDLYNSLPENQKVQL